MKPGFRVHMATVGFQVRRITEPLIRERVDKVYILTSSHGDKAAASLVIIIQSSLRKMDMVRDRLIINRFSYR